MKFMIDLHGTIDKYPEKFLNLLENIKGIQTNKVYICSGSNSKKIYDELSKIGFEKDRHYDYIISIIDYFRENNIEIKYDKNGNPWVNDDIWWQSKGNIAKLLDIDIVIDDSIQYKENMPDNIIFLNI